MWALTAGICLQHFNSPQKRTAAEERRREDRGPPESVNRIKILTWLKSTRALVPEKTTEGNVFEDQTGVMFFSLFTTKTSKTNNAATSLPLSPSSLVPSRVRPTVPEPKHQKPTRNPTGDLCFTERRTEFVTPVTQLLPWLQLATVPWWQTCTVYTLSVLTHLYTIFFTRYYRWKYHVDLSNQTRSDPGHRFTFLEASGAFLFRTILSCGGISTHLGHIYLSLEGKRTGCNERIMLAMKYFKANVS